MKHTSNVELRGRGFVVCYSVESWAAYFSHTTKQIVRLYLNGQLDENENKINDDIFKHWKDGCLT